MANIHFFTEVALHDPLYTGHDMGKPNICSAQPLNSMEMTAKCNGQCSKKATNIVIFNKEYNLTKELIQNF